MALHSRLYRSLLQHIRQFKRDELPLLGLAGTDGQAVLPNVHARQDLGRLVGQLFRQPPSGASEDSAFAALRVLGAQSQMLLSGDELTRSACSAWRKTILGRLAADATQQPPSQQPSSDRQRSQARAFTPRDLARSLEETALLVAQLHYETQQIGSEDMEAEGNDTSTESEADKQYRVVMAILNEHGLGEALDEMARQVRAKHPALFPTTPAAQSAFSNQQSHPALSPNFSQPRAQPTLSSHSSSAAPTIVPDLLAIQRYLYRDLRLRHEPIEWLYDGISPLLLASALAKRKGAPFTLAVLACLLCDRLGVAAVPIRASPPTAHVSPTQAALAGGVLMPDDVAARQAGRAASYLAADSWLLAAVHAQSLPGPEGSTPPGHGPDGHRFDVPVRAWLPKGALSIGAQDPVQGSNKGSRAANSTADTQQRQQQQQPASLHASSYPVATSGGPAATQQKERPGLADAPMDPSRGGLTGQSGTSHTHHVQGSHAAPGSTRGPPSSGSSTGTQGSAGQPQEDSNRPAAWEFSGLFLDVSVRGGFVMNQEQVLTTYPQALEPYFDKGLEVVSAATFVRLCSDWVRAIVVAHQRRGESDLVAHWLVQLLALDPTAPEWDLMLGNGSKSV